MFEVSSLRADVLLLLVLGLAVPTVGAAQAVDASVDVAVGQPPPTNGGESVADPAGRDGWDLELTGKLFRESWDMNQTREQLVGGAISVSRHMTSNWTVGVETSLFRVNQARVDDVFVPVVSLMLRWSAFWVGKTSVFFDGGVGVSYASGVVPNGGTRLNLVSQAGVGIARPLSPRFDLVGGLRWLHLSNNGLDGPDHNPDIQALGLYVGWRVNSREARRRQKAQPHCRRLTFPPTRSAVAPSARLA